MTSADLETVYRYHDGTKHHFNRFARSLGYLDWASQPRPFRSYAGSLVHPFDGRAPASEVAAQNAAPYADLFVPGRVEPARLTVAAIGDMLRHAFGLSAWKILGPSRWALRVNPSSGNLHPTEAYVVTGPLPELSDEGGVWHYAPDRHAIERRCAFDSAAWPFGGSSQSGAFLVALTSIHWRESWKYGERGFRYCQHDLGHAIGALSVAAALFGWQIRLQPECSQVTLAALIGIDRDQDYVEAEREEAGCLILVSSHAVTASIPFDRFAANAGGGRWSGQASQLSEDHVQWTFIDEVAAATRGPVGIEHRSTDPLAVEPRLSAPASGVIASAGSAEGAPADARRLILQRRSAVALDGLSAIGRAQFVQMLAPLLPGEAPPWPALWWTPRIHLAIFVHRVTGLDPGLYLLLRDPAARLRLETAFHSEFSWQSADPRLPLYRLATGPFRAHAQRLSCDQAIAGDGFFSLAMIADFDRSLLEEGPWFYRHLFWEAGVIGQMLYLEAEAAAARGTGIGCFYDDAVHDTLGLTGHAFQSLYHFTVGIPVEDRRLTTEPGYEWEHRSR